MNFVPTELPDVIIIEPRVFRDDRGFFLETYHQKKFADGGIHVSFVQDNHSRSGHGTLRGMHLQRTRSQGKLVRAIEGEIFDVAADVRRGSPTFGKWIGVNLSSENFKQLYVPPGFAHGFCVLSEVAEVEYKCTDFYAPDDELTILWNDETLAIKWPAISPLLSPKDARGQSLNDAFSLLPQFGGKE
jgi:dTDP-4-dehydrorhamnose 3,5-epimerase